MFLNLSFAKILETMFGKKSGKKNPSRSHHARLQIEVFESREVPAVLTIGGSVYEDKNGNGIRDISETGLGGVPLELRNAQGILVSTTISASDGTYRFDKSSSLPAQSLTKKYETTVNPTKANYTGVVSLPGFDSSLGILDSVELVLTAAGSTTLRAENLEDDPETVSMQPTGSFKVSMAGLSAVEVTANPAITQFNLGAADGVNDYAGTSGRSSGPVSLNGSNSMTFSGAALSMFSTSTINLNLLSRVSVMSSSPGNVLLSATSMVNMNVAVVYHYRAIPPLDPGNYTVTEASQPTGYYDGLVTTNNIAPIPGSIGLNTVSVTLAQTPITQLNFGEVKPVSVSGLVRMLPDGITQQSTQPILGAIVTLQGTNDMGQAVNKQVVTAADGTFSFAGLRPGTYELTTSAGKRIMADALAGSAGGVAGTSQISQISLPSGTNGTSYIFNAIVPSTLVGTSYQDNNANGIYDANDSLLANVNLTLTGTDYKGRAVTLTTKTDSFGEYSFANVLPGTYTVKVTTPTGMLTGGVKAGSLGGVVSTDSVSNIKIGQDAYAENYDFAFVNPAKVTGFVYHDQNNDGARSVANSPTVDPGVGTVTVTLTGQDINGNPVNLTTKTLADGSYEFSNLKPGTYRIQSTVPTGYLEGKATAGNANGAVIRSSSISGLSLSAGQTATDYNFGLLKPTVISGVVANDLAANNRYDAGDPGLAGIILTLTGTDAFGKAVSLQTATGAGGAYSFGTLTPGNYTLRVGTIPVGYTAPVVQNGSLGGTVSGTAISLALNQGTSGTGYNFLVQVVGRSKRGFFN